VAVSVAELANKIDEAIKATFRAGFTITVHEDGAFARIVIVGTDLDLKFRSSVMADAFRTEPFKGITHLWTVLLARHVDLLR
jgi:hypothetical protein